MRGFNSGTGRRCLLALLLATSAVAVPVLPAVAQSAAHDFHIPAGPLAGALNRFADESGLQLVYDSGITQGLTSPALSGGMSADQALRQLLNGSGITWRFTNANTVTLQKVSPAGAMTLDPVNVEGANPAQGSESAYGPVRGYVAKRSATVTKTDSSIMETPQSISVVSAEELEARNVQTLEDAIKYTPGVVLSYGATGDTRSSWYKMRGFPITTTFYRDGLKVSGQNWQRIDSYLMERVEILRGPASVMYGQNVPGGLVNMVSKRPQDIQAAEAAVEYGSFDWKRAEGDITGPLDEKKQWLYRVSAAVQDSDGLNGIDHDKNNRRVFAPAVTWKPKDGTDVTISVVHQEDDSRGWWPRMSRRTAAGKVDSSTYLGEPDYDDYHQEQTHLTALAEHEISDRLKFSLTARYSNYDMDYRQSWPGLVQTGGMLINRANYAYKQDAEIYSIDARAEGKLTLLSMEHTVLGGVDYFYQDRDNLFGSIGTDTPINLFNPAYGSHGVANATAWSEGDIRMPGIYLQDQISVGENWVFLLGGRQDLAGSSSASTYKDTFTGRLGVAYKTDFGMVPYASYAESFEPQSGTAWGGAAFKPTTGRQYEVGVKYEPPGVNAMATVAVFDLVKQNVLTSDPDLTHLCNGTACSVQTGEVTSRGIELGLTMGLAEGLNAVASYTYNPISVTKSNAPGDVGRQQADQPIHTASLWLDYGVQDGPLAGFGLGGGLRFIGRTTNSAGNVSTSPQVLDEAMARYDIQDWRLSLNVKNLLDREVEYSCTNQTDAEICYLNEPLTITARVSRKF